MKMMTIDEAAKKLGVSHQTLRNWEESGIVYAERTKGGHRRYRSVDIEKLSQKRVAHSYELILYNKIRCEAIESFQKEDTDNLLDNIPSFTTPEEWNCLLYRNFDICNERMENDNDKRMLRKIYAEMIKDMISPYLVRFGTSINSNDMLCFSRMRGDALCIEMEEICCKTRKLEYDFAWASETKFTGKNYDYASTLKRLLNLIDEEVLEDLSLNAGTLKSIPKKEFDSSVIKEMISEINNKAQLEDDYGDFWVLTPPELRYDCDIPDVLHHESRHIKPNQVLIGYKSKNNRTGYALRPICFCVTDGEQVEYNHENLLSIYGKKLFRQGANFFARIDLE